MLGNRSEILRKRAHYCKGLPNSATNLATTMLFFFFCCLINLLFAEMFRAVLYYLFYCIIL